MTLFFSDRREVLIAVKLPSSLLLCVVELAEGSPRGRSFGAQIGLPGTMTVSSNFSGNNEDEYAMSVMAAVETLTEAHVLLLAVQLTSEAGVEQLHRLAVQRPDVLKPDLIYRILFTCLPVDASNSQLVALLKDLRDGQPHSKPLELDTQHFSKP